MWAAKNPTPVGPGGVAAMVALVCLRRFCIVEEHAQRIEVVCPDDD